MTPTVWLLVLMFLNTQPTIQEFTSDIRCQAAAKVIHEQFGALVLAECFAK